MASLAENGAHADTGEDVHVVALAGDMLDAVVGVGGERRAGGEDHTAVGPVHGLLEGALRLDGGVREREDDRALVESSHLADNRLGEDTTNGAETKKSGGLDVINNLLEGLELLTLVVVAREKELVLLELIATVVSDETLGVNKPDAAASLILGGTVLNEELNDLAGNTNGSRAGTHEDEALVLEGDAASTESTHDTTKNNGTGTLNVIVEHGVGVAITLERREGVLEILKLNDETITNVSSKLREPLR